MLPVIIIPGRIVLNACLKNGSIHIKFLLLILIIHCVWGVCIWCVCVHVRVCKRVYVCKYMYRYACT